MSKIYENSTYRTILMYIIELSVVIIIIGMIAAIVRTFGDVDPPILLREPAIVTAYAVEGPKFKEAHEVHIQRDITYYNDTPVLLSTELINKDNETTIDLPDTKITSDKVGTFNTHKLYFVSHLIAGHWCIKSTIYWVPTLSFSERSYTTKESCFIVSSGSFDK